MQNIRYLVPYPRKDAVKGDGGTILIVGGSKEYTGAPYFAALASFRSGAELVYILSESEAVASLKPLLPEAIVVPIGYHEWILRRVTACAIGPGLGRLDTETLKTVISIAEYLKEKDVPLVIDGDGLSYYSESVFRDYNTLFITPNVNEMKKTRWTKKNHCVIEKGKTDIIRLGDYMVNVSEEGSIKRCCGQGDILVGILCAFLSWLPKKRSKEDLLGCAESSCRLVRLASRKACAEKWISLTPSDVLEKLQLAICETGKSGTSEHDTTH